MPSWNNAEGNKIVDPIIALLQGIAEAVWLVSERIFDIAWRTGTNNIVCH